ncbi:MAG: hypothetical protein JNL61_04200 [Rhizobiaceae bacterium]|nr:hypothetical protein [Rhizobiaceae bacterium]
MIRQPHTASREVIVANAISEVVSELRMVELADYVAFIRLEHFACLADIVDSAAERFFMPGTVRLGHGGEAEIGWDSTPRIALDLELRPQGATVYFTLGLTGPAASVDVNYVAFDNADPDPDRNTAFLARALEHARIHKSEPAVG